MAFSALDEYEDLAADFRDTFDKHMNENNFKQGAFNGKVDKTTEPLTTLNRLINSTHTTTAEKSKFRKAQKMYTVFETSDLQRMTDKKFFKLCHEGHDFADIFRNDAQVQGSAVAPTTVSSIDPATGDVVTYELTNNGKIINIREGEDPNATLKMPDFLNKARTQRGKDWVEATQAEEKAHKDEAGLRRAKQAKRNAMELERKKKKKKQSKQNERGAATNDGELAGQDGREAAGDTNA